MSDHNSAVTVPALPPLVDRVQAFRSTGLRGPGVLSKFLPDRNHRDYQKILRELVRADVELRQRLGESTHFAEYRRHFPDLRERDLLAHEEGYWTLEEVIRPISVSPSMDRFAQLPEVGEQFLGFHLIELLGKGGFGAVYLAEQTLLAGRKVALKVTTRIDREPERLAKLQHTNIVPIYSVHVEPPLQAMCMPYLGKHTLADLVHQLRVDSGLPGDGSNAFALLQARQCATRVPCGSQPIPRWTTDSGAKTTDKPPESNPLVQRNRIDAVLWLVARIADGLQHAHERGVIHRDLKPANILLSDDGQPMLLDFNLAVESSDIPSDRVGGTLAYIAPEQLSAVENGRGEKITARSDLFGLGVIFYELLTGREPFAVPANGPEFDQPILQNRESGRSCPCEHVRQISPNTIRTMLTERQAGPPSVRKYAPQVSPAIEAIVRHLLEPDPLRRYASAAELASDLERQMKNLPLRFAPEPSWSERGRKWLRRNPTALPILGLILTGLASIGFAIGLVRANVAGRHEEAINQCRIFSEQMPRIRAELTTVNEPKTRDAGVAHCRELLATYGVLTDPSWRGGSLVQSLQDGKRRELIEEIGEALLLLARAEWNKAKLEGTAKESEVACRVRDLQNQALVCFEGTKLPSSIWSQVAEIAEVVGDPVARRSALEQAKSATLESARDFYLQGTDALSRGQAREARELLEAAIAQKPDHYPAHFSYAYASQQLRDFPRAMTHYRIAATLRTDDYRPYFNRGVILCLQGRYRKAEQEYDKAIAIDPKNGDSYRQRAIVRMERRNFESAIEDLDRALELNVSPVVVSLLQAQCYDALHQPVQALRVRSKAENLEPKDEGDFLTRAAGRVASNDPTGALSDLKEAVKLNPYSLPGLQNQAHVLGEMLGRQNDALKIMDRVVELYPDFSEARAGRAVLLARLGRRDDAHAEIQKALILPGDATIVYQAACVYSITSGKNAGDLDLAIEHLRRALRNEFRDFAAMDNDRDIDALRKHPEFGPVARAARELYRSGRK